MEDESYDKDDWLKSDFIQCQNCKADLLWIEHSPFENSYYLYCNSCPKRVDVNVYDSIFRKIEDGIKEEVGEELFRVKYFDLIMPVVEENLAPCECGGKYLFEAIRRCVYCNFPVIEGERNLWFTGFSDDSKEAIDFYHRLIKNENLWK